jgi:hypothetical protein
LDDLTLNLKGITLVCADFHWRSSDWARRFDGFGFEADRQQQNLLCLPQVVEISMN